MIRLKDGLESNKDQNHKIVLDQEKEYKTEIELTLKELEKADNTILELRKEVDYHKQNLLTYRSKRQGMEKDMEILIKNIEKYKKESNYQITEIKMIDNENKNLLKENVKKKLKVRRN